MSLPSHRRRRAAWALGLGAASLIVAASLTLRRRVPPPIFPIELPQTLAWASRTTTVLPDGSSRLFTEAFAADGAKFRLEVARPNQAAVVWVFDGTRLVVNASVPVRRVEELDPRNSLLGAYASLRAARYEGGERVEGRRCWSFALDSGGVRSRFLIDVETHLPRRVSLVYDDGRRDEQLYADLPVNRLRTPGLYDSARLESVLVSGAEAMFAP